MTILYSQVNRKWIKKPDIFFQEHDLTYFKDVLSGIKIKKTFYLPKPKNYVLDLGCGIGFWSNLFVNKLKIKKIISADLSSQSLKISKLRVKNTIIKKENAEKLSFSKNTFHHINCQGVIHHSPNTQACVDEIYRVLKNGGTASVSVYYKNIILKSISL